MRSQTSMLFILITGVLVAEGGTAQADPVPTPTVTAAPTGTRGFPFPTTLLDLAASGYVEEEVFIEGAAGSYVPVNPLDGITDGRWDATATGPTASYKTRLLIRRPTNPAKFNGTVLFEWLNVSAGFDSDSFDPLGEPFMNEGYAYVGVSAQGGANGAAINFLKFFWDPARYGTLSHPGDSFSYDIFSQSAQAVLAPNSGDPAPLGNLTAHIKRLIAWGGSQSGSRLFTYYNAVHPTVDLIDGFVPFISTSGAPLSQAPQANVVPPGGAAARIRTDSDTPVLWENSESEFAASARGLHSQPDSARFRLWEHSGTSHANRPGVQYAIERLTANGIPVTIFPECGEPPINDVNVWPVWRATLTAMNRWIKTGWAPTPGPRVQLSIPADPAVPATIVRDSVTGLAKSGIRLPHIDVPNRTLSGGRPPASLAQFPTCFLFGASDPWNEDSDAWDGDPDFDISPTPEPSLLALYKKKARYVGSVGVSALRNVLQGYLLPHDALEILQEAANADVP